MRQSKTNRSLPLPHRFARPLVLGLAFGLLLGCSARGKLESSAGEASGARPGGSEVAPAVLEVGAVYDDTSIQIRLRFATDQPSWYHQYLVFEGGRWVRHGAGTQGPDPRGLFEDRISLMWDDGSVAGFEEHGGRVTAHAGLRSTRSAVSADAVREHPYLGGVLGRTDVRKFVRESRREGAEPGELWSALRTAEEIRELRSQGVFLDLWQWRAHRSNPIGYADNGYVLDYRHNSAGRGMFTDNLNGETGLPIWMYDPAKFGRRALSFEALLARGYGQDDPYFLSEAGAVPFDPEHGWQEGDALPMIFLREPAGSRGAIRAQGRWSDGAWHVRLTRSLAAPDPLDSKAFEEGRVYHVAFAVHSMVGARHHRVSRPVSFALGEGDARIVARRVEGPLDEAEVEWVALEVAVPPDPTPDGM